MTEFKVRGKVYTHIADGWCARQLSRGTWRIFWGLLPPGSLTPRYVTAHEEGGSPVELPSLAACISWVEQRKV